MKGGLAARRRSDSEDKAVEALTADVRLRGRAEPRARRGHLGTRGATWGMSHGARGHTAYRDTAVYSCDAVYDIYTVLYSTATQLRHKRRHQPSYRI